MYASSPLALVLFKFGVVCAVEVACIKAMGEMFEPWVMQHDAVLGLVGTCAPNLYFGDQWC